MKFRMKILGERLELQKLGIRLRRGDYVGLGTCNVDRKDVPVKRVESWDMGILDEDEEDQRRIDEGGVRVNMKKIIMEQYITVDRNDWRKRFFMDAEKISW